MTDAGPAAATDPRLGMLQLVAVKGDSVGARFETSGAAQPVTIGRKPTNDFVLRDVTVSREHAVIEPTADGWRIMARKNSARLLRAGEQVPEDGVLLVDGDEIHLGLAVVKVTIVPAADDGEDDRTVVFVAGDVPAPSVVAPRPAPPVKDEVVPPPPPVAAAVPAPEPRRTPRAETPRERFGGFDVFAPVHDSPTCRLDRAADAQGSAVTLRRLPSASLGFWARRRFMRAVNGLRGIEHENLLAPIEAGRAGDEVFIVYPPVEGVSAGGVLREGRRDLPIELAAYIVGEAARGLAHAERAVHPLHLALGDGEVVCRRDGAVAMLLAPPVPGAVEADRHRAPEETAGGPVDVRAAIFSLGVVLWELLARDPIPPGQQMTLRSIDAVRIQVPPALSAATMCAVEVRPDDRFAHADEFADALADALARLAPGYGKDAAARWLHEHVSSREGEPW